MSLQEAIEALRAAVSEVASAALSDDKTPLLNALALRQAASLVGTGDNPDVVIFGDLNRFKSLNDQFGHEAGDIAINQVGELIHKLFVQGLNAQAFRRSGDEFVILLPSTEIESFKSNVSAFTSCEFLFEGETRRTAMSFGYAISSGDTDFADLLTKAETACLIAKRRGDGTYVEWSEELNRQAVDVLRDRCPACQTEITCRVPKHAVPANKRLLYCPCCGATLAGHPQKEEGSL